MKTRRDDEGDKKRKEQWKISKQKERENWTPQKKAAVNRKRRNQRREKKEFKEVTELAKKTDVHCLSGWPSSNCPQSNSSTSRSS